MPLNAGDTGYGSVSGAGLVGGMDGSETAPLLIPEPEPEPVHSWRPLSRVELEASAGGPGWRRARSYLVLLFWLSWLAMLATAVAIIVVSPRPVVPQLQWWQKSPFYLLRPQLLLQADGSQSISVETEQLPFLKSLGIGALILQGLFDKKTSPLSLDTLGKNMGLLTQIQHLLTDITKADLKVVLDFCEVDLLGPQDLAKNEDESSNTTYMQHAVRFWMEQGVAGFVICDTDEAYSEKTLLEWRSIFDEFSSPDDERIVVVKQTREDLLPLSISSQTNVTLVNVVMRSILPYSPSLLSAGQVAEAIETHLKMHDDDTWLSWMVGGRTSSNLKKLLLVLTMTLPGSPTIQNDEEIGQTLNSSESVISSRSGADEPVDTDKEDTRQSTMMSLLTSLGHSRAREEALLYGSFTFLPFNTSTYSADSPNTTLPSPPVLAFLRSWGCVHFLILLNVGPKPHPLDPAWAPSLPQAGVFVSSTGLDRLGSTSLYTLLLQPYEAIVIKLFQGGSYS